MDYKAISTNVVLAAAGLFMSALFRLWTYPLMSVSHMMSCVCLLHVEGLVNVGQHASMRRYADMMDNTLEKLTNRGVWCILLGVSALFYSWLDVGLGLALMVGGIRYIMQAAALGEEFPESTRAPWLHRHDSPA